MSEKVKHTEGPWEALIGKSDPLLIVGSNGFPIAEVGGVGNVTKLDEANAHLIAAALEMKEEWKEEIKFLEDRKHWLGHDKDRLNIINIRIKQIKNIIAKAEGRS